MKSLRIAELLQSPATDAEVVVKGWVRTKRGNKNVAFIALNDGSCVANMQVVVDLAKFDEELLRKVTTGACLRVDGRLVASCGAGQGVEVQAEKIEIYGTADPETILCRRRDIRSNSCATSLICVPVPTRSVRFSASVTRWPMRYINISTTKVSITCIRR